MGEPFISKRMKNILARGLVLTLAVPVGYSMWHGANTYAALMGGMTKTENEQRFSDIYEEKFLGELQNIAGKPGRELMYLLMGTNE